VRAKGVCYDVGRVLDGLNWRPVFEQAEVRRELEIIRDDLHATAVKIHGQDLARLTWTAQAALGLGLEVWLSPELWDHGPGDTLDYLAEGARAAEGLRREFPGRVVLSAGTGLMFFMPGFIDGATTAERLSHPDLVGQIVSAARSGRLTDFLGQAARAARGGFGGQITYASLPFERVDWSAFDIIGVDLYRDCATRERFPQLVRDLCARGRPVAVCEFGCCPYRGAQDAGSHGFDIVDYAASPPRLKGDYIRDEHVQAAELAEALEIFDREGVDAAFVFTFSAPLNVYCEDPRYDFDMASFSLVKSYGNRLGGAAAYPPIAAALKLLPWDTTRNGTTYPGIPWDPKAAFHAVARAFAGN
jgi:hypothetical protein